jgi:hypothetical protein
MQILVPNIYVGKGAVGFGEKERYTDFSGGIAKVLCEEKMDMAFRLDFCFFWLSKRK